MAEKFSSVPWRYDAVLTRRRRVDDEKGHTTSNELRTGGAVYPDPYDMATAVSEALAQLAQLTDIGWGIERLHVRCYNAPDMAS